VGSGSTLVNVSISEVVSSIAFKDCGSSRTSSFLFHVFAATLKRNSTGLGGTGSTSAFFYHLEFKPAILAHIYVTFFHLPTICHFKPSFLNGEQEL
jgi:hypothetical protein